MPATRHCVRISIFSVAFLLLLAAIGFAQTQSNLQKENPQAARPIQIKRFYPKGKHYRTGSITTSAPVCNSPQLSYFDGPVTSNVQVVPVFWNSKVTVQIQANISQFYSDATVSSWFDSLNQYSTGISGGTNQFIGRGSSTSGYTITPAKCPASQTATCNLSDSDVQAELAFQITAAVLPPLEKDSAGNVNTVYMVYFPPNISLTGPSGAGTSCVSGGFCAYHNTGTYGINNDPLPYGAIMDTFTGGCSVGCGSNSTALENTTDVSSHELAEAVTDTDIGLDTQVNFAFPAAWADNNNSCGEIGDICDDGGAGSSIVVGGRTWVVQEIWSNEANACVATGTAPTLQVSAPGASSAGTPFNFSVAVKKSSGTDTNYTGTVAFSSSDTAATLPAPYTFKTTDQGTAIFSATLSTPGAQSIRVTDIVNGYVSGNTSVTVSRPTNVITFSNNAPTSAVYNSSFSVAASASSGLPVVFTSSGACTNVGATYTMTNGTGTCSVTANQPGNSTYPPATQVTQPTAAAPAGSGTLLASSTNVLIAGQSATLSATVSGAAGGAAPSGTVSFMLGTTALGAASLVPGGLNTSGTSITIPASQLVAGPNTLSAVYSGDFNYLTSTSPGITVTLLTSQPNFGAVAVGTTAAAQQVVLVLPNGGTVNFVQAVTQGAPNLDFSIASGGTCSTGTPYSAGQPCSVNVSFGPMAPGLRMGAVQLLDSSGNVLATSLVYGVGQGPELVFVPAVQTTIFSGAPGVNRPVGTAVDAAGDAFITDEGPGQVLKIPAGCTTASCRVAVGSGLSLPDGVAVDGAGDVFIADRNSNQVVEVPSGCTSTSCQTTVGSGLSSPQGVAVDGAGDVFIADTGNNRVVEVPAGCTSSSCQTTVGSGLSSPASVAVDGASDIFIADTGNNRVVEVPAGCTSSSCQTTVGSGLNGPWGVAVDGAGDVLISDTNNGKVVDVPAGCTTSSCQAAVASGLAGPLGVAVDGIGDAVIADTNNYRVVEVQGSQAAPLSFGATNFGSTSSPQTVTVQNVGSTALAFSGIAASTNFTVDAGTTTCSTSSALGVGASCIVGVACAPTVTGPVSGTLALTDNVGNKTAATQQVSLSCTGSAPIATTTNVTIGDAATGLPWSGTEMTGATAFAAATVNPSSVGPGITGTVTYGNGNCIGNGIGTTVVGFLSNGSLPNSAPSGPLPAGTYVVQASYSGDTNYLASSSFCLAFSVGKAPSNTVLGSNLNPSTIGQMVTFTATITVPSSGFRPTGTVIFYDGGSAIGTGTVSGNSASYSTFSLIGGSHSITAQYGGDSNFLSSTSPTLSQVVTQASTTTTLNSSPNPSAVGQSVTFTARITASTKILPTGTVTFYDGGILIGTATVANSSASLTTSSLGSGAHSIVAQYNGDANFLASSSSVQQVVNMGLVSSPNPSVYGQTVTFTATVAAGGNPTGNVLFSSGTTQLASVPLVSGAASFSTARLPALDIEIIATYAGSPGYPGGSTSILQSVTQAPTSTAITGQSGNPSIYGDAVTFTATVNSGATGAGGNVLFMAGALKLGGAPLVKGVASFTTKSTQLPAGTYAITATYNGDPNHVASTSAAVTQVVNQATTTTVLVSSLNPSNYGQQVTFTATVSSGATVATGLVTFTAGTVKLGGGKLVKGLASLTTGAMQLLPGSYQVTASYVGNTNQTGSTSAAVTQVVNKAGSGTALTSSVNPSAVNQQVALTAAVSGAVGTPTGKVQFKDGTKILGAVLLTNGTATLSTIFTTAGQHNLSVTYSGSGRYLGSVGTETQTVQ